MPIKIKLHGRLRDLTGKDEILINKEQATLRELLEELMKALGDKAKEVGLEKPEDILVPRTRVLMIINGVSVKMIGDLNMVISSEDKAGADHVDVLEGIGGG